MTVFSQRVIWTDIDLVRQFIMLLDIFAAKENLSQNLDEHSIPSIPQNTAAKVRSRGNMSHPHYISTI